MDPKPIEGKCPFWDQYQEEEEPWDMCITCSHFERYPELDRGSRRRQDIELAHVCAKDAMDPEVYYNEPEPVMPWE